MTRRPTRLVALCLLLGLFSLPVPAAASGPVDVPPHDGYVTDRAGVLGEWGPRIEASIADLERETSFEIGVLTIDSIGGEDAQPFAQRVYERWKIGKKGKDNGLLFLVAVRDRKIWIATGYGAEKILPDGRVGEIRDAILRPAFRGGRYGEGLFNGVGAVAEVVRAAGRNGENIATPEPRKGFRLSSSRIAIAFVLVVILVAFVGSLFGRRGKGPPDGRGGGPLGGFPMGGGPSDFGGGGSVGGDFGGGDSGGGGAGGDY
jgi:uncharacterized protein